MTSRCIHLQSSFLDEAVEHEVGSQLDRLCAVERALDISQRVADSVERLRVRK